jgi:pyridoxamine 5'-phosphate oxidase
LADEQSELAAMRREYMEAGLEPADLPPEPIAAFRLWFDEVVDAGLAEPNAMVVSTAGPSSRMTLLKSVDARGFVFFTNYTSRKARELDADPRCSLLFPWHGLRRQVIVTGTAARVPRAENEAYFASRPRGSQLGAWASRQSSVIADRSELEDRYGELEARWPDAVPCPDFWGGYVITPNAVEFWQGRPSRLHDRLRYTQAGDGWIVERLAP